MLFNSVEFLVFFTVVVAVDFALRHRGPFRRPFLLAASYFFYGSWDWRFLGLILLSTVVDYWVGARLARTRDKRKRKALLMVSLGVNLGVLGVFKYLDFFIDSFNQLIGFELPLVRLILPVGISFYTFQTLSYTIDIYREKLEPTKSFLDFALFVAFFPQLVAGPIVRAQHFLPQLKAGAAQPTTRGFAYGTAEILAGLFKKIVIADSIGIHLVDPFYADPAAHSWDSALIAMYAYPFQVYGDFAGYSQIAIGVARLLGFRLPRNFKAPYTARTMVDIWRRWHISFSSWIRDYLYIPMGGSRGTAGRVRFNIFMTMTLAGLWHGAGWNFVLWGSINGVFLVFSQARERKRRAEGRQLNPAFWRVFLDQMVVYTLWVFTLVVFRAGPLENTGAALAAIFRGGSTLPHDSRIYFHLFLAAWVWHLLSPRWGPVVTRRFANSPPEVRALVAVLLLGLLVAMAAPETPFMYFRF